MLHAPKAILHSQPQHTASEPSILAAHPRNYNRKQTYQGKFSVWILQDGWGTGGKMIWEPDAPCTSPSHSAVMLLQCLLLCRNASLASMPCHAMPDHRIVSPPFLHGAYHARKQDYRQSFASLHDDRVRIHYRTGGSWLALSLSSHNRVLVKPPFSHSQNIH